MKKCVIVGGAGISDYDAVKKYFDADDFFVFCDSGLKHLKALGVNPDLIVGDFDSFDGVRPKAETIVLPCEKDDTDTVFAVKEALRRGFEDFVLIGAVGERFDHSLGNVSILAMLESQGKSALLADDYSEMMIVADKTVYIDDSFVCFSLLNLFGRAEGICIENAKYNLSDAEITCEYQYGISNEVIPGKKAAVRVKNGRLLLIKVRKNEI